MKFKIHDIAYNTIPFSRHVYDIFNDCVHSSPDNDIKKCKTRRYSRCAVARNYDGNDSVHSSFYNEHPDAAVLKCTTRQYLRCAVARNYDGNDCVYSSPYNKHPEVYNQTIFAFCSRSKL